MPRSTGCFVRTRAGTRRLEGGRYQCPCALHAGRRFGPVADRARSGEGGGFRVADRAAGTGVAAAIALWIGTGASCRFAARPFRSEEHTSELQSLMRISYAVFCLKKTITNNIQTYITM